MPPRCRRAGGCARRAPGRLAGGGKHRRRIAVPRRRRWRPAAGARAVRPHGGTARRPRRRGGRLRPPELRRAQPARGLCHRRGAGRSHRVPHPGRVAAPLAVGARRLCARGTGVPKPRGRGTSLTRCPAAWCRLQRPVTHLRVYVCANPHGAPSHLRAAVPSRICGGVAHAGRPPSLDVCRCTRVAAGGPEATSARGSLMHPPGS